jgi:hypothetical protein
MPIAKDRRHNQPVVPAREHRPEWLTEREAADHLRVSINTLRRRRRESDSLGGGVPYSRLGRRILYERSELDRYLLDQAGRRAASEVPPETVAPI